MATTTNYAFPYPSENDSPNGAAQIGALATAVDTKIREVETGGVYVCTSLTRPVSPGLSKIIYETDTHKYMIYTGVGWTYSNSFDRVLFASKPSSTSRTSTTTITDDPHLTVYLQQAAGYQLNAVVRHASAQSSGDMKFSFNGPGGTSFDYAYTTLIATATVNTETYTNYSAMNTPQGSGGLTGVEVPIVISGIVQTGAAPGDLRFQWAQLTSNATSSTVMENSYMVLHRIF